MIKKQHQILFASIYLLAVSCAQIVSPAGGIKDNTPPKVVKAQPQNQSLYFNSEKITIEFDEFIQLNNTDDQIIISPPTEQKPEYILKGKLLDIRFKEQLQPNTTYTINFGNAIGDNKENNLLQNYSYVFSTGSLIDSLGINGTVYQAFNKKAEKEIVVGLYKTEGFTDSTLIKEKPLYLTKTNELGNFTIKNLPAQSFLLVAFKDENKNLKKEKTEQIAFATNPIIPVDSANAINLFLFNPKLYPSNYLIDTFSNELKKFVFSVYQPEGFTIKRNDNKTVYNKWGIGDTLIVFTEAIKDEKITFILPNQQEATITHKALYKAPKFVLNYTKQPELNDSIKIQFNHPVIQYDTSKVQLMKDSIVIPSYKKQVSPFEFVLYYPWVEKSNYQLVIKDSAFKDVYDQFNKKEKQAFLTKAQKDYATLLLHVQIKQNQFPYLLQLVKEKDEEVMYQFTVEGSRDIQIDYVLPGNYKIKFIKDLNKNGKWDNGEFTLKQQPEPVSYFPEVINIKAYWDLEQSVFVE